MLSLATLVLLVLGQISRNLASGPTCDVQHRENRFDCYPGPNAWFEPCTSRQCCWKDTDRQPGQPFCYFPTNYPSYDLLQWLETEYGFEAHLRRQGSSPWPNDVQELTLKIWFETKSRIHFKMYDSNNERYEVPITMPPLPETKASETDYEVTHVSSPFGLKITRKSTGAILFDSTNNGAPLIFADQFLQITTALSSNFVYGIGEHLGPLLTDASLWTKYYLWPKDQPPMMNMNLYGSHPFYINMESNGDAHGVFLLNSNAMEVIVQSDPALTFRTIGGILDFYIYTGPTPEDVVQQYVQSIGLPAFPPYWSLGFQMCRYNYGSVTNLKEVIERNRNLGIPYEAQWADIDYMEEKKIWTYDKDLFAGLPELVEDLHQHDQKFVVIVDSGVGKSPGNYPPYDKGLERNVFIKDAFDHVIEGKVWPGVTVFPDFTHPNVTEWWYEDARDFHNIVPYDALWIDMNEPASFENGSPTGCSDNRLDNPPYLPGFNHEKLEIKTLCPSAKQYLSSHYNLHSMYGLHKAIVTDNVLKRILNKRTLLVSRSSFPSLGKYGQHWSGDIKSSWEELYYSIPSILSFQFFGIPFVGADVCGFREDTTEELCIRWMQLGAFYPFFRNHNDDRSRDQDPAAFSADAQQMMKEAIELRYTFLPFFYTQLYFSHISGSPIVRPLLFLYPKDTTTYSIDKQFVWGDSLLVTPVLSQAALKVQGYFGEGLWYDVMTGEVISGSGEYHELDAPLGKINIHLKGGSIIPRQDSAPTISEARKNPFNLLIALNELKEATGKLFLDDGESLDSVKNTHYSLIKFSLKENTLVNDIEVNGYAPTNGAPLSAITIFGVNTKPSEVLANGVQAVSEYDDILKVLHVTSINVDLMTQFSITWH